MWFVPFPALTEADRIAGLALVDMQQAPHGPAEAVKVSGRADVMRVRLLQRSDGPVYLLSGLSGITAFHTTDLSDAKIESGELAAVIAMAYARRHGQLPVGPTLVDLTNFDQWTVAGDLDRPLYRLALGDEAGTEIYVSSVSGEVVRGTTRFERQWNYVGSVAHWIYPIVLRSRPTVWNATVWSLSLLALIGATTGSLLGILNVKAISHRLSSPYRNLHWWHHMLGLLCMTFVLTWIFSGWLSMDSGRLFSTGALTSEEAAAVARKPAWETLASTDALFSRKSKRWNGLLSQECSTGVNGWDSNRSFYFQAAAGTWPIRETRFFNRAKSQIS